MKKLTALISGGCLWLMLLLATAACSGKKHIRSQNYKDGEFKNLQPTQLYTKNKAAVYWEWLFGGADDREPEYSPEIVELKKDDFLKPPTSDMRVTWLGHATIMVELAGKRILIDPMFSDRVSPIQMLGPKRFHKNPISIKELPPIDVILVSHDHFDHLDENSIGELKDKTALFITPLQVGRHLVDWGVDEKRIRELDWQQSTRIDGVEFICTPARHFSGRKLWGMNQTLWASWVIKSATKKIYYSGDTGPMPGVFKKIGDEYGPFDLTMMQLGMYGKNWPQVHMTPAEAIAAHKELRGKVLMPVHWGTFALALHGWNEPIIKTKQIIKEQKIPTLDVMPGRMFDIGKPGQQGADTVATN